MKPSTLLTLILGAISPPSPAATLAVGETLVSHDTIFVTDERRDCPPLNFHAEKESPEGKVTDGCWTLADDNHIVVEWASGVTSIYPIAGFHKPDGTGPRKDI